MNIKSVTNPSTSYQDFLNGLVFGFDLGTGSIGYAVRRGSTFLDVGVIICPEETADLAGRRGLRRQRRTLRSRKYRRQWFAQELATVLGLELNESEDGKSKLMLAKSAWEKDAEGAWMAAKRFGVGAANTLINPVHLRLRGLKGEALAPEELHIALCHLFRRRGYCEVPWKRTEEVSENNKKEVKDEDGIVRKEISDLRSEMDREGMTHPCEFLSRISERHQTDGNLRQRNRIWPRELVEQEFRSILESQKQNYPKLAEKVEWLLFGDTQLVKDQHVYFKSTEGRNPGILGLRWPKFDNRGPALDALHPNGPVGTRYYELPSD